MGMLYNTKFDNMLTSKRLMVVSLSLLGFLTTSIWIMFVHQQYQEAKPIDSLQAASAHRMLIKQNKHESQLMLTQKDTNWVNYHKQCHVQNTVFANDQFMNEIFLTNKFLYIHVLKAAGTTIFELLKHYIDENYFENNITHCTPLEIRPSHISLNEFIYNGVLIRKLEQCMDNDRPFIFTFVRDPIDKFLSAFYQLNSVIISKKISKKTGHIQENLLNYTYVSQKLFDDSDSNNNNNNINISANAFLLMREWIDTIYQRMNAVIETHTSNNDDQELDKTRRKKRKRINGDGIFINKHFKPNIGYIPHGVNFNVDFIGNLNNFKRDFVNIIKPLLKQEYAQLDGKNETFLESFLFSIPNRRQRDKNKQSVLQHFNIKRDQLEDDDIKKLCHIYWQDYLCFPFTLPKQCDRELMMHRYYGTYLVYNK